MCVCNDRLLDVIRSKNDQVSDMTALSEFPNDLDKAMTKSRRSQLG